MVDLNPRKRISSAGQMFGAFEERNFRLLWLGRFSSNMGRTLRVFLRGWLVWQLTDSTLLMGIVISSLSWPMLFMPFLGGVVADRIDRRRLLIITETLLVILWAAVSLLLTLGLIQWWHFIVSSIVSGVIQSFGRPGHLAMVADVVDKKQLPNAVALDTAAQTWPGATAPVFGVLLIPFIGVAGGFWLTTLTQIITVVTIFKLDWTLKERPEAGQKSAGSSLVEGFRHVASEPVLLSLVALGVCTALFAQSYNFLLPVFADEILGLGGETRGVQGLGVLLTGSAIGASVGSAVVIALSNSQRRGLLLLGSVVLFSLLMMAFSHSNLFWLSLIILFFMRIMGMITQTINMTAMQLLAPDHLRARVMSLHVLTIGLSPIGVMIMGALAEPHILGVPNAVMLSGAVYGLVTLLLFASMPALRRFR
jgi:MFS family permease